MNEKIDIEDFPKLDGGWCDGLGCSEDPNGYGCWCEAWLESREAYQKEYKKPFNINTTECKIWEAAWRYSWNTYVRPITTKGSKSYAATKISK